MASSFARKHPTPRRQATEPDMQSAWVWDSSTLRVRAAPSVDRREPRTSLNDIIVAVCFLALIGLVLIGGPLLLLSRVVATLPVSPRTACPEFEGCVVVEPDENEPVVVDDRLIDGPKLTR